ESLKPIRLGYAMRGNVVLSNNDQVQLMTVGYWLERFLVVIKDIDKLTPQIIVVDEVHDSSWQTDLALRVIGYAMKLSGKIKLVLSSATVESSNFAKMFGAEIDYIANEEQAANVDIEFLD